MKVLYAYITLFMLIPVWGITQNQNTYRVIDNTSKHPIAYANILNMTTHEGVLSNAEGFFQITTHNLKDNIRISCLGYYDKQISTSTLITNTTITLTPKEIQLHEIEVSTNNNYIYDILSACRKHLKKQSYEEDSKAYFMLYSTANKRMTETIECYYNAHQKGGQLHDLYFKNGRLACKSVDSGFFFSWNMSKAFSIIDLLHESAYIPLSILQCNKNRMKKKFEVSNQYSSSGMYKISFEPKDDDKEAFSGHIWIDKQNYSIKQLKLHIKKTARHPFLFHHDNIIPLVSISLQYNYNNKGERISLDHTILDIDFTLSPEYYKTSPYIYTHQLRDKHISIHSVLYYYDFNKPFILPYMEYHNDIIDYRKLALIPYNVTFWSNKKLLLTNLQRQQIDLSSKDALFINYNKNNYGSNFLKQRYRDANVSHFYNAKTKQEQHDIWGWRYYYHWAADERIRLNFKTLSSHQQNTKNTHDFFSHNSPISDKYHLEVKLLLDINPKNKHFDCKSYTIFDLFNTFYHIDADKNTDIFINIYFDICEIERRKMAKTLSLHNTTLAEIDSIYQATIKSMKLITQKYTKEVQRGLNYPQLEWWNTYVKNKLGIDNIQQFQKTTYY